MVGHMLEFVAQNKEQRVLEIARILLRTLEGTEDGLWVQDDPIGLRRIRDRS